MSSDRPAGPRALFAPLILACALLLGSGTAASAQPAGPPARAADAPSARTIADALEKNPVYVDRAYAAAVTPAQQKDLAGRIAATGLPIKVVLVPLKKGDVFGGSSDSLASVIRERLGDSDLILITNDDYGSWLKGTEWPAGVHQARDAAAAVGFMEDLKDAGLAARIGKAVQLIDDGTGTQAYERETARLDREASARPDPDTRAGGSSSGATTPVLVTGAAAVAVAGAAGFVLVRRRRPRRTAFSFPDAVFAAERSADEAAVRRRAAAELLELGEAVERTEGTRTPGLARALDAYDAAGRVLDAADALPDLVGALALVAEGRSALAGGTALPLCFFDPLHGTAARRTVWRPVGRRERVDVAVCRDCDLALRGRRSPHVLAVTDRGRTVPYFEVPAARSLWAATGYGSLLAGPDDTLASRVTTGGFSRARRAAAAADQDD
ncbi:hypothetical protein [Streptomyces sp. NPDC050145]|uniref:hypothetical protein n=1 Tax=Streptomyces sp. NPDC050145 TaxID=3365602 RepID=UPI0037B0EBD5